MYIKVIEILSNIVIQ